MSKPRINVMRNVMYQMVELIKRLCANCTDQTAVAQGKELTRQAEELLSDRSGL